MNRSERARRDKQRHRRSETQADRRVTSADLAKKTGRRDHQASSSDRLDPVQSAASDSEITIEDSDCR